MTDSEGTEQVAVVEKRSAGSPPAAPSRPMSASAQSRARRAARPNAHGLTSIFDENHPRYTHGWYFRPPVPRPGGNVTTGLPIDCFFHADAYTADLVDNQQQKSVGFDDGSYETIRLITPVDRYGMRSNGVPAVAIHGPTATPEAEQVWERVREVMEWARPIELEYERETLESIYEDLRSPGNLTPGQRTAYRERARIFEARVAHLGAGYDWPGILQFFELESERSKALFRSPESRMQELIQDGVRAALAEAR